MRSIAIVLTVIASAALSPAAELPTPESAFGFEPGADRRLVDYEQLVTYLDRLASATDRLELREVGRSPQDRPMYVLFASSPDNLARLDELREINRRLALDTDLSDPELEELVRRGRAFVMATLSMHSSEVGPSQALPAYAYELATTDADAVLSQLDDVVWMLVPSHNPDGMDMVVEHYRSTLGTDYEGASLPGVYHRYVGHDNNRDFITLSQDDTRVISALYSTQWYPQVLVEKHQMGRTGPRYFVPPNHDPIAENVDADLWNWIRLFGAGLSRDMGEAGHTGVATGWLFDNYWPGSTETSLWKGVISFLTEAASAKVATPVFIEPTELRVGGKGLSEYAISVNMPEPWPGRWWRLGDIVAYEMTTFRSILATAARHSDEILRFRNRLARAEVERGRTEAPYFFVLPEDPEDRGARQRLVRLLEDHGVELTRTTRAVEVQGRSIPAGAVVVPLAQPFRAFVKEVLEAQRFPVRHYTPEGEVIRPYDIASWSLPLHHGATAWAVDVPAHQLRDALEPLPPDWHDLAPVLDLSSGVARLAWLAGDVDGYASVFEALGDDRLEVRRTTEAVTANGTRLPAGTFLVAGDRGRMAVLARGAQVPPVLLEEPPDAASVVLRQPRVALVETFVHDMDAGWTRYVLDSFGVPFTVLRPGDIPETDLGRFDVIVFPDADAGLLKGGSSDSDRSGYWQAVYAPEYRKGMGRDGLAALTQFLLDGGNVVSWRRSTELFTDGLPLPSEEGEDDREAAEQGGADGERLSLPVRNVTEQVEEKGLYVPGSWLRVGVLQGHPLTWGLPAESGIFSRGGPVFATSIPMLDTDRRVVVHHPDDEDLLLSGYAENAELLGNRPVGVWLRVGRGQLVLYGFNPQFRASTAATYPLLFNALLLPEVTTEE